MSSDLFVSTNNSINYFQNKKHCKKTSKNQLNFELVIQFISKNPKDGFSVMAALLHDLQMKS